MHLAPFVNPEFGTKIAQNAFAVCPGKSFEPVEPCFANQAGFALAIVYRDVGFCMGPGGGRYRR